jgi:hypothetical protein
LPSCATASGIAQPGFTEFNVDTKNVAVSGWVVCRHTDEAYPMASDIFAKIGDIKGESTDAKHKDEIEVLSFS